LLTAPRSCPTPSLSSAEAEYNVTAFGISGCEHTPPTLSNCMASIPTRRSPSPSSLTRKLHRWRPRTRHSSHSSHPSSVPYASVAQGTHYFKIDGPLNPSDIGTKLQDYITFMRHRAVITEGTTVVWARS
jgi:hypothetical protein